MEEADKLKTASDSQVGEMATEAALQRGDLYQKLLRQNNTKAISDLFDQADLTHRRETGWRYIVGRAGTGKTTLAQYISYRWGLSESLWNNRFEFVFRLKLNLVGEKDFGDKLTAEEGVDYLAWVIDKSLKTPHALEMKKITKCLTDCPQRILIILDGFDEVAQKYNDKDTKLTRLIDAAMEFPNGILTSRPLPKGDFPEHPPQKLRHFENLGLKEQHIQHYSEKTHTDRRVGLFYFKQGTRNHASIIEQALAPPEIENVLNDVLTTPRV